MKETQVLRHIRCLGIQASFSDKVTADGLQKEKGGTARRKRKLLQPVIPSPFLSKGTV